MKSLKTSVVVITPKLAAQWLKTISRQRPISDATVQMYVEQVKAGKWELSGQTIVFSDTGHLLDGQHRLMAVERAGKSIECVVVRGVKESVYDVLDTGRKRNTRDALVAAGIDHAGFALASAVTWILRFQRGVSTNRGKRAVTNREAVEFVEQHRDVLNSLKFGSLAYQIVGSVGLATAMHYLFRRKDVDQADQFLLDLGEGAGLNGNHPVHLVRKRLIANRIAKQKLSRLDVAASIIKAWNLVRSGKHEDVSMRALAWTAKGPAAEDFPVIK